MQFAASVRGHWRMPGKQALGAVRGQHILAEVVGGEPQAVAQALSVGDQRGIVFEAGQRLPRMGQQAAQMALAGAPVEPVDDRPGELQAPGEQADLLPLASRYVDVEAVRCLRAFRQWQFADRAQRRGLGGELRIRRGRGQAGGLVVLRVGLFEAAPAQPGRQLGVFGFPRQGRFAERAGSPEPLVFEEERVQREEALRQGVASEEREGFGHDASGSGKTGRRL